MGFFGKPILEKSEKHHFIVTERFYEVTEQDIAEKGIECTFKSKEYSVEIFMSLGFFEEILKVTVL